MTRFLLAALCLVSVLPAADLSAGRWRTVPTDGEPLARHEAAFVASGGKFYLMGGRGEKPVEVYDPETNAWSKAAQPPIEIHHFQPVDYEGKIYVVGALTGKYPAETPVPHVLIYDPAADEWSQGPTIPADRRRGAAGVVVFQKKVYVVCGIVDGHRGDFVPWLDEFNPATGRWRKLRDAPRPRDHFQAVALDGKLYAVAGRTSSQRTGQVFELTIPEVDVYNFRSRRWSTLDEPIPTPRAGNSAVAFDEKVLVFGGESGVQRLAHSEVEAYDPASGRWETYPPLVRGRHGTGVVVHHGTLYTAAGSGGRGGGPELSFLEVYSAGPERSAARLAVDRLLADPQVKQALAFAQSNEPKVIEEQIRLTEIPAPPFTEQKRAEAYKQAFEQRGLENVRIDAEGNVLGERKGRSAQPHLVLSAHLDTVFPAEIDVQVKRDGDRLAAPGIGDDGRGLAVVLGVIDALNHAEIETEGPTTFVGTVGEEGLGDLRGVKHLFKTELEGRIDRFVSIDGTGFNIANGGVGSYRYRVAYKGPGGHSYGSFGMPNPAHALGRLIAKLADFQTPSDPKTTFSVGRVFGGTSVNSIAFEAAAEVDLRSADKDSLETLDAKFRGAAEDALREELDRWGSTDRLELDLERVGHRPSGETPADSAEVQATVAATEALGFSGKLRAGSTDSNVGMSLGVPSVTINGGGSGNGAHSPGEAFDTTESYRGVQRALLVALALSSTLD